MAEEKWRYEKVDENYDIKSCPMNDLDGKITGKFILNLPAYFDENPDERIALGYIKHYYQEKPDVEYNKQTQFLMTNITEVDAYTVRDTYIAVNKSEEMLCLEELGVMSSYRGNRYFIVG